MLFNDLQNRIDAEHTGIPYAVLTCVYDTFNLPTIAAHKGCLKKNQAEIILLEPDAPKDVGFH